MKAVSALISSVLLMAAVIAAISIMLAGIRPAVTSLQDSILLDQMEGSLLSIDSAVKKVAAEPEGSRRTMALKIAKARLVVNGSEDSIEYLLETDSEAMSPRTSAHTGSLEVISQPGIKSFEGNYTRGGNNIAAYILENRHLKAYFRSAGSREAHTPINTSGLLLAVYQKDLDLWQEGILEVSVDGQEASKAGLGYTELAERGEGLPYATVSAYVNSSYMQYYVNFTLESGMDFLQIRGGAA